MVVVRTKREPGDTGFSEASIDHALIPTLPGSTEITVGVCIGAVVVEVDDVDCAAIVVVVVSPVPTTNENMALLEKLYELPVHVPPVGLSRPYAYIWYVPTLAGAVMVTLNVAVRRSAERDGLP